MLNELFTAEKEKGAFLNGNRISVSKRSNLSESLLVTGFPYDVKQNRKNFKYFRKFVLSSQAVRRDGSAALDLCYTAMGRFDGFWEFSLSPWDMAAGSLILKEAGGKITLSDGRPFSIYKGEVLASNGPIHTQMTRILASE
jgi:myo-inositol-1(or 4)-monophosphatase